MVRTGKWRLVLAGLVALFVLGHIDGLGGASAAAQEDGHDHGRVGPTFGIDLGVGHMGCTTKDDGDCAGTNWAGGAALHGGFLLTPHFAVLGDLWVMAHTDDRTTVSQMILTGGLRFWLLPRLWLQAGIGASRVKVSYDATYVTFQDTSDWALAGIAAVGVEVLSGRHFALDVLLRGGTGLYQNDLHVYNISLGVGATWY